ncbi:MAG TPA: sialidase family protein [Chitinophagaceae bacterium]|nr:sialidase family protein [Chitinophagaceae bacterium]
MKRFISPVVIAALLTSCGSDENKQKEEKPSELQLMESPVDSISAEPYLFTDKNGVVYLSWVIKNAKESTLKFSMLKNGNWSEPTVIASGNNWFVNWADYPIIASDGNQNIISHYLEKSEKGTYTYDVKVTTSSDNGNSWSPALMLHDDGKKAEHGFVSIVPYNENYFISWLDGRNAPMEAGDGHHEGHQGQMTLRGAIVDKVGKKSGEWELDNRVCDCCQTSTAITTNGPVVVYRDRTENEIRDISIVRLVNGQWTQPAVIFPDNWKIQGCPVNGPQVAADGNNLAVAWFTSPEKKSQVNVAFSRDGGASFSKPARLDEGKALGRVDIVLLDSNTAMVSWLEGSLIKAARVHNNGTKDSSMTVASTSEARSSGFPQMTKSGTNLFFAWTDDKEKTIKVARLPL